MASIWTRNRLRGNDPFTLRLLEEVKVVLDDEKILSLATVRLMPLVGESEDIRINQFAWRADYYRKIAERVDQIAVMSYDSGLFAAPLYQQFMRFQVIELSQVLVESDTQLFIGLPVSEEKTWTHNPQAENIESGLAGIIQGLNDAEARPKVVTGVAIYPHWEMTAAKWNHYEQMWLVPESPTTR